MGQGLEWPLVDQQASEVPRKSCLERRSLGDQDADWRTLVGLMGSVGSLGKAFSGPQRQLLNVWAMSSILRTFLTLFHLNLPSQPGGISI